MLGQATHELGDTMMATRHDQAGHAKHHPDPHAGHDKHEGHSPELFRRKFWLSLALTVGILAFDEHFLALVGLRPLAVPLGSWIPVLLGAALFAYGGWPFVKGARVELMNRTPGMMTLITLGISVAFLYSLAATFGLSSGMTLWWELATLVTIMLLGHWIEMASVQGAGRALDHLASLIPSIVHRLGADGRVTDVGIGEIAIDDRILIRPGEQVPVDGCVIDGASSMNEAFLTGESRPVSKDVGDEVVAGAVNGEGALTVQVMRAGDATTLSQIQRLVSEAQASRSRFQQIADRAAGWLVYIAVGAGLVTFFAWQALGFDLDFAIVRTVTVLVMACPHALGLAIPLVVVNATSMSAQHGILVRNREAFERARNLRVVAFDKTGTLTEGRFGVESVHADGIDERGALRIAAALETRSEHPLARAVRRAADERGITIPEVRDFAVEAGRGVTGTVDDVSYLVGRPEWAAERGLARSADLDASLETAERRGDSVIALMDAKRTLALIALVDTVRPSARQAVTRLLDMGVTPVMVTGDADAVARTVAAELGIERYHARVLPQDKAAIIRELKQQTGATAFVGDGINDAPALLEADLGVAIGAGTNVAIESADLVLVQDDPEDVVRALALSRATYRKMIQNLFWATGYNAIALPLAAGVAYSVGIMLSPAVGAVFMSASTIVVAVNAMLLRRTRLT